MKAIKIEKSLRMTANGTNKIYDIEFFFKIHCGALMKAKKATTTDRFKIFPRTGKVRIVIVFNCLYYKMKTFVNFFS